MYITSFLSAPLLQEASYLGNVLHLSNKLLLPLLISLWNLHLTLPKHHTGKGTRLLEMRKTELRICWNFKVNLIFPKIQQILHRSASLPAQPVFRPVLGNHLQQTIPAAAIPSPGGAPRLPLAGGSSPGAWGGFLSMGWEREGRAGDPGIPGARGGKVWEEGCSRSVYRGCCKRARERPREILGPSQSRKVWKIFS